MNFNRTNNQQLFSKRTSGVLMPVFCLPSKSGIGCFDRNAYEFVDRLQSVGQSWWQILPLSLTNDSDCPYSSISSMSIDPIYIDIGALVDDELIDKDVYHDEMLKLNAEQGTSIDYNKVRGFKMRMLKIAFSYAYESGSNDLCSHMMDVGFAKDFKESFAEVMKKEFPDRATELAESGYNKLEQHAQRLADIRKQYNEYVNDVESIQSYRLARFLVLREYFDNSPWYEWSSWAKNREGGEWDDFKDNERIDGKDFASRISFYDWCQYIARSQWLALKKYANSRGIGIIGDLPFYCNHDSYDVWARRKEFAMEPDESGNTFVSAVPPDYFSPNGQVWNNPLYDWEYAKNNDYLFQKERIEYNFELFDVVRLDHFRAYAGYYCVQKGASDAKVGHWRNGCGQDFFQSLEKYFQNKLPFIAEDLGMIDQSVRDLIEDCGFPNMKVMQFGYDGNPMNEHLFSNFGMDCVAYTGTHDNQTLIEWLDGLDSQTYGSVIASLWMDGQLESLCVAERDLKKSNVADNFLRALFESKASTVIVCYWDLIGARAEARINIPGKVEGNWKWRETQFQDGAFVKLKELTHDTGRDTSSTS